MAKALTDALRAAGWAVHAPGRAVLDVTNAEQVTALINALPRIDLLVNNAAIVADGPAVAMTEEAFSQVLDVNLRGSFLCARAAVKKMSRQRQGHIVNVGSYAALAGTAGQSNYAAAKAGLIALTKSIAKEYGLRGIRCNCVLPGFMETKMTQGVSEKRRAEVLAEHCLGAFTTTAEAARFIVALESFKSVSGQVFQLDSRVGSWS